MSTDLLNGLDETDLRILKEVQDDGRARVADLARRLSMSRPAVSERLGRLERAGVIRGYHADVDPAAVGYGVSAIVRVRPAVRQLDKLRELAVNSPEVVECHRITGDDCLLLKVRLRALPDLEPFLDRFTPYGQTTTSIIHSTPVVPRGVPLDPL